MREALKGNDTNAIQTAYTELQNNFQAVSEDLYKQATAAGGGAGAAGAGPEPHGEPQQGGPRKHQGDVVDAEFEVVDDDKKK